MKITVDFVTNSSSESFGTVIRDSAIAITVGLPFLTSVLKNGLDGEESEIEPVKEYISEDPNDPPGTIIAENADGSITKKKPDGTVATKYPDGTIHGTMPDGTVCTVHPDGMEIQIDPEGTKTTFFPDGRYEQTKTDGTFIKVNSDGSSEMYETDGTITYENTDGSSVVEFPDGDKNYFDEKGDLCRRVRVSENGVGSKYYNKDGTTRVEIELNNGAKASGNFDANENGVLVTDSGGKITYENGKPVEIDIQNDDTSLKIKRDGSMELKDIDENGVVTEIQVSPDEEMHIKTSTGTDVKVHKGKAEGKVVYDDVTVEYKPNGDYSAEYENGMKEELVTRDDGTSYFERKDAHGNKTTLENTKDSKTIMKTPDGKTFTLNSDNTMEVTDSTGKTENYSQDEVKKILNLKD